MSLQSNYQQKINKNYHKFLVKGLKDQCIGMNVKKSEDKNTINEYRYRLESKFVVVNRLFVLTFSNQDSSPTRYKVRQYYSPKDVF